MAKLDRNTLDNFQAALEEVDASWQTEFNLREVVRESFFLIQRAREYKVSWEKIAEVLQQSSDETVSISPVTIRQYYFEILRNPEEQPKPKRKSKTGRKPKSMGVEKTRSDKAKNPIETKKSERISEQSMHETQKEGAKSQVKHNQAESQKELGFDLDDDIKSQFNL